MTIKSRQNYGTVLRVVAWAVVFVFTLTSVAWKTSAAYANTSPSVRSGPVMQSGDLTNVSLPTEIGKILETYRGTSDKTVVLIQDAHSIPDAQRSIRSAIAHFQKEYGVTLVGLEGASETLDPQIFRSFPDKELLCKTFDDYSEKGELTGGTAAALFSDGGGSASGGNTTIFHGIEDWELYEKGIASFLESMKAEGEATASLEQRILELEREKEAIYPKDLLEVDRLLTQFGENKIDLTQVLSRLSQYLPPPKDSELAMLLKEIGSNTDIKSVTKPFSPMGDKGQGLQVEIKKIADQVETVLKSRSSSPELKQGLQAFYGKRQEYQTAQITPQTFALFLKDFAKQHKVKVKVSHELVSLVEDQKKLRDIEGTRLFEGFKRYADAVKEKLIGKSGLGDRDLIRQLNARTQELALLKRLAKLELSFEDWTILKKTVDSKVFSSSWVEKNALNSELRTKLEPHLRFYRIAEQRDGVFYKNLTDLMKKNEFQGSSIKPRAANAAILVAGGFHTGGLTQTFKEKGISYILVMPRIDRLPEASLYREHMQGNVSWKNYFEVKNGKVNLYDAFVRATRDKLLGVNKLNPKPYSLTAKEWRDQIIRDLAEQGRITEVSAYTRFMDELSEQRATDSAQGLKEKWLANIDRFGTGLKKLQTEGKLSESGIAQLLKSITTAEPVLANVLAPQAEIRWPLSAQRSEVRAMDAEWLIGRIKKDLLTLQESGKGMKSLTSSERELLLRYVLEHVKREEEWMPRVFMSHATELFGPIEDPEFLVSGAQHPAMAVRSWAASRLEALTEKNDDGIKQNLLKYLPQLLQARDEESNWENQEKLDRVLVYLGQKGTALRSVLKDIGHGHPVALNLVKILQWSEFVPALVQLDRERARGSRGINFEILSRVPLILAAHPDKEQYVLDQYSKGKAKIASLGEFRQWARQAYPGEVAVVEADRLGRGQFLRLIKSLPDFEFEMTIAVSLWAGKPRYFVMCGDEGSVGGFPWMTLRSAAALHSHPADTNRPHEIVSSGDKNMIKNIFLGRAAFPRLLVLQRDVATSRSLEMAEYGLKKGAKKRTAEIKGVYRGERDIDRILEEVFQLSAISGRSEMRTPGSESPGEASRSEVVTVDTHDEVLSHLRERYRRTGSAVPFVVNFDAHPDVGWWMQRFLMPVHEGNWGSKALQEGLITYFVHVPPSQPVLGPAKVRVWTMQKVWWWLRPVVVELKGNTLEQALRKNAGAAAFVTVDTDAYSLEEEPPLWISAHAPRGVETAKGYHTAPADFGTQSAPLRDLLKQYRFHSDREIYLAKSEDWTDPRARVDAAYVDSLMGHLPEVISSARAESGPRSVEKPVGTAPSDTEKKMPSERSEMREDETTQPDRPSLSSEFFGKLDKLLEDSRKKGSDGKSYWNLSRKDEQKIRSWMWSGQDFRSKDGAIVKKLFVYILVEYMKNPEKRIHIRWFDILREKWDLRTAKQLRNLFRWFRDTDVDIKKLPDLAFADFLNAYLNSYRNFPGWRDNFNYIRAPGLEDREHLERTAKNIRKMTTMFPAEMIQRNAVLKAPIEGTDYYIGMEYGFVESTHGVYLVLGEDSQGRLPPDQEVIFRVGVDTQGDVMRIVLMQGGSGKERAINEEVPARLGMHPSIALFYVVLQLAFEGKIKIQNKPDFDPPSLHSFSELLGLRRAYMPTLKFGRSTMNVNASYSRFGLRREDGDFGYYQDVGHLMHVTIPGRLAQNDLQAHTIEKMTNAFHHLQLVPGKGFKSEYNRAGEGPGGTNRSEMREGNEPASGPGMSLPEADRLRKIETATEYAKLFTEEEDKKVFVDLVVEGKLDDAADLVQKAQQAGRTYFEDFQLQPRRAVYPGGLDLKILELFPNLEVAHFINLQPFRLVADREDKISDSLIFKDPQGRLFEGRPAFDEMRNQYLLMAAKNSYITDELQEKIIYPPREKGTKKEPQIGMEPFIKADLERRGASDIQINPVAGEDKVFEIRFRDILGRPRTIYYHQADFFGKSFAKVLQDDLKSRKIDLLFVKGFNPGLVAKGGYPKEFLDGLASDGLLARDFPGLSYLGTETKTDISVISGSYALYFERIGSLGGEGSVWGNLGHKLWDETGTPPSMDVFRPYPDQYFAKRLFNDTREMIRDRRQEYNIILSFASALATVKQRMSEEGGGKDQEAKQRSETRVSSATSEVAGRVRSEVRIPAADSRFELVSKGNIGTKGLKQHDLLKQIKNITPNIKNLYGKGGVKKRDQFIEDALKPGSGVLCRLAWDTVQKKFVGYVFYQVRPSKRPSGEPQEEVYVNYIATHPQVHGPLGVRLRTEVFKFAGSKGLPVLSDVFVGNKTAIGFLHGLPDRIPGVHLKKVSGPDKDGHLLFEYTVDTTVEDRDTGLTDSRKARSEVRDEALIKKVKAIKVRGNNQALYNFVFTGKQVLKHDEFFPGTDLSSYFFDIYKNGTRLVGWMALAPFPGTLLSEGIQKPRLILTNIHIEDHADRGQGIQTGFLKGLDPGTRIWISPLTNSTTLAEMSRMAAVQLKQLPQAGTLLEELEHLLAGLSEGKNLDDDEALFVDILPLLCRYQEMMEQNGDLMSLTKIFQKTFFAKTMGKAHFSIGKVWIEKQYDTVVKDNYYQLNVEAQKNETKNEALQLSMSPDVPKPYAEIRRKIEIPDLNHGINTETLYLPPGSGFVNIVIRGKEGMQFRIEREIDQKYVVLEFNPAGRQIGRTVANGKTVYVGEPSQTDDFKDIHARPYSQGLKRIYFWVKGEGTKIVLGNEGPDSLDVFGNFRLDREMGQITSAEEQRSEARQQTKAGERAEKGDTQTSAAKGELASFSDEQSGRLSEEISHHFQQALKGRVILHVDDDPADRATIQSSLEKAGAEVLSVTDGKAALEILGKRDVDAVVTDANMPEMSGAELVRKVQAVKPEISIVMATRENVDDRNDLAHQLGITVVRKNQVMETLSNLFKPVVSGSTTRSEIRAQDTESGTGLTLKEPGAIGVEGKRTVLPVIEKLANVLKPSRKRADLNPTEVIAVYELARKDLPALIQALKTAAEEQMAQRSVQTGKLYDSIKAHQMEIFSKLAAETVDSREAGISVALMIDEKTNQPFLSRFAQVLKTYASQRKVELIADPTLLNAPELKAAAGLLKHSLDPRDVKKGALTVLGSNAQVPLGFDATAEKAAISMVDFGFRPLSVAYKAGNTPDDVLMQDHLELLFAVTLLHMAELIANRKKEDGPVTAAWLKTQLEVFFGIGGMFQANTDGSLSILGTVVQQFLADAAVNKAA